MSQEKPWTSEQKDVFEAAEGGRNLAVSAVAGSGKTTTGVEAIKRQSGRLGFFAFNKHIATELSSRLEGRADACTFHSYGFRVLLDHWPEAKAVREWRYESLFKERFPEHCRTSKKGHPFILPAYLPVLDVVRIARQQLIEVSPDNYKALLLRTLTSGTEWAGADTDECMGLAGDLLDLGAERTTEIDYTDMLWLPVRHGWVKKVFDCAWVDEAQDLNPLQQALALQLAHRHAVVGDPNQAIMGFAGADVRSFDTLRESLSSVLDLPLNTCFRCPSSHIALAEHLVPRIASRPGAPAGSITCGDRGILKLSQPGDMIICRANAPLMTAAFDLILSGIPCHVRGKDYGKMLAGLVRKLRPSDLGDLAAKVERWKERQLGRLEGLGAGESAKAAVIDKADCLHSLAEMCDSVDNLLDTLENLFADEPDPTCVVLSSIHKAKGLEADNVTILDAGMMPRGKPGSEELEQDTNLLYVALTRAKQCLRFADVRFQRKDDLHEWLTKISNGKTAWDLTERVRVDNVETAAAS